MDQVSRPLQIALLAALSFAVLWFIALRPKPDSGGGSAAPSAPAKAPAADRGKSLPGGLGNAVDKARNAQAQENSATQRSNQASNAIDANKATKLSPTPAPAAPAKTAKPTPGTSPKAPAAPRVDTRSPGYAIGQSIGRNVAASGSPFVSAPAAAFGLFFGSVVNSVGSPARVPAAAPATAPGRARRGATTRRSPAARATASPAAVSKALASGKVVVLLFWSNRSSDDRAVHSELSKVGTHGGRAFVGSAPIRDVSRYNEITTGVEVLQSPTIVVVNRLRRATLLTGYTDHTEIAQAVAGALAAR